MPAFLLGGLMLFALPACLVYMLAYFLLASDWKDETFTPYMGLFLTALAPIIWASGTAIVARFYPSQSRKY